MSVHDINHNHEELSMMQIQIQPGRLAATHIDPLPWTIREEEDVAAKNRTQLTEKLQKGQEIQIGQTGNVTNNNGQTELVTPPGKLAAEETAAAKIRKQLAEKLEKGQEIKVGQTGNVTNNNGQTELVTPPGKLANRQWYETDPNRLRDEIAGMNIFFPYFKLYKMDDGRYYWHGMLKPGVLPNGWSWEVAAIYQHNHPHAEMGSSVHVVLLKPDIQMVIDALGWRPHHLLYDSKDGVYLCTTRAEDLKVGTHFETTAIQSLSLAVKWLTSLELVMSGEMSKELFNRPGGI